MNLQQEMDEAADHRDTVAVAVIKWRTMRGIRAVQGNRAYRGLRSTVWRGLQRTYATKAGASIGLVERLVIAGSVWPTGRDE